MLDTRKIYLQNDNPIQGLVNFESTVQQLDVEYPVQVKLSDNGKKVQFIHNGLVLTGIVDRTLMH